MSTKERASTEEIFKYIDTLAGVTMAMRYGFVAKKFSITGSEAEQFVWAWLDQ